MQAEFRTAARTRTTVVLNLDRDFYGIISGWLVAAGRTPDWTSMLGVGITLSTLDVHGDRTDTFHNGPFSITVHSIVVVSWQELDDDLSHRIKPN